MLFDLETKWLENRSAISPNVIAISDNSVSYNYAELYKKVIKQAEQFARIGIASGDRVAFVPENSIKSIIDIYALWEIEAVPVLLHKRWTAEEKENQTEALNCRFFYDVQSDESVERKTTGAKVDNQKIAVIIFTSGTTTVPKAVALAFENLYFNALIVKNSLPENGKGKWLLSLPIYHIGGFAMLTRALLLGGSLTIPRSLKTADLIFGLETLEPNFVSLVSAQFHDALQTNPHAFERLKAILLGGGPIDKKLITQSLERNLNIFKVYGSTETASFVTAIGKEELKKKPHSAGKAIRPATLEIIDEKGVPLPPFSEGEIAVISPTIAHGYLNSPDLNKTKFLGDKYLTGDIGYMDEEGYLYINSRREDLIITGGENVTPAEVEEALNSLDYIQDSFVLPLEDVRWGQIVAALVVAEIKDEEKIKKDLKKIISSFKIPKKLRFVNEIPLTDTGKKDRKKAKELFEPIG